MYYLITKLLMNVKVILLLISLNTCLHRKIYLRFELNLVQGAAKQYST